jgi:hypothetical protein
VGQGSPYSLVIDLSAGDPVEPDTVDVPSDVLLTPVGTQAVDVDAVDMESVVGEGGGVDKPDRLIASAAGVSVAVDNPVDGWLAVDVLKDVNLTASRPQDALSVAVAEEPEGRPETLLIRCGVAGDTERCYDADDLAGRGSNGEPEQVSMLFQNFLGLLPSASWIREMYFDSMRPDVQPLGELELRRGISCKVPLPLKRTLVGLCV